MKRNAFLTRLLHTIVAEYGHEEVLRTLSDLPHADERRERITQSKRQAWLEQSGHREVTKPKRLTAVDQLTKTSDITVSGEEIFALATRFDRKEFLPTVGDIREFLAMSGSIVEGLTSRSEGFRYLLPVLVKLPPERLKRLATSNSYSGPSQLGPLADAIRSAGEAMRRGDQKLTTDADALPLKDMLEDTDRASTRKNHTTLGQRKTHPIDDKNFNNVPDSDESVTNAGDLKSTANRKTSEAEQA